MLEYQFFRYALLGIIIVSLASALVGAYVVSRRMVFVTGGITHASFGGLGLGFFMGWNPLVSAAVVAVASAFGVEFLSRREHLRHDSAIGVVWALGMALGTMFIFLTPGYVPELTSFLFGDLLTVTRAHLIASAVFLIVLLIVFALLYRPIMMSAFDPSFARTRGVPAGAINLLMTVMVSVCVVLMIRLIGIMLLMSLLTIPQVIAERHTRRFVPMAILSAVISVVCSIAGLVISAITDVPTSATIVLLLAIGYVLDRVANTINSRVRAL